MPLDINLPSHPRTRRLFAFSESVTLKHHDSATGATPNHAVIDAEGDRVVSIRLEDLEACLEGFRDTGTWDDYFTPADSLRDVPELKMPNRYPKRTRYKIDTESEDQ